MVSIPVPSFNADDVNVGGVVSAVILSVPSVNPAKSFADKSSIAVFDTSIRTGPSDVLAVSIL